MKLHESITSERVMRLVAEDNYLGICTACGSEADTCEPDARKYECETCGEKAVYGAEELLFHIGGTNRW